MRTKILLATLLLTLLAVASSAAPPDEGMRPRRGFLGWDRVSQFDEDGDGTVSREELERGMDLFSRLDSDGDGVLTEADFTGRGRGRMRERMVQRHRPFGGFFFAADGDGNGEITQNEWSDFVAQTDSDGDGVVDNLPFGPRHPPEGPPPERMGRFRQFFDRDGNGQLETSELEAIFAERDQNGDGTLTRDELRPRHRRGPGGAGG